MPTQEDQFPQGGDLSDMAASGTSVSGDAAKPNYIPSKASPARESVVATIPTISGHMIWPELQIA